MWLHIDAAYAGSAFICPEFRHLLNGVEVGVPENTEVLFKALRDPRLVLTRTSFVWEAVGQVQVTV